MFGLAASMMPIGNYNRANRVTFQTGMSKQAITKDKAFESKILYATIKGSKLKKRKI